MKPPMRVVGFLAALVLLASYPIVSVGAVAAGAASAQVALAAPAVVKVSKSAWATAVRVLRQLPDIGSH